MESVKISGLTPADEKILKYLLNVNHSSESTTAYNIFRNTDVSLSNVHLRLRCLIDRGFVARSRSKTYYIRPNLRQIVSDYFSQNLK